MKIILVVIVCMYSFVSNAQVLVGEVEAETSNKLGGVHVWSEKTSEHTHTKLDGSFHLRASLGETIFFEKEGFRKASMEITKLNDTVTVILATSWQSLREVQVSGVSRSLEQVANVNLNTSTIKSSQEALTLVPGLFVAQHAGGGKAEQLFLRGFDLDHGTDIQIGVDEVPVNSVSHAHGQGYTDLHFLLPQLIDKIEFEKGPYQLDKGNFATAGWVNFRTKRKLDQNELSVSYGAFNELKLNGAVEVFKKNNQSAYIAGSWNTSDGYFESAQDLNRVNLLAKYTSKLNRSTIVDFTGSLFSSSWRASGQIPLRAVSDGSISRFGAIDDTEGGNLSRKSVQFGISKFFEDKSSLKIGVFSVLSDFELFSNFTFFLNDSVNGDQIKQKENRKTHGVNVDYVKSWKIGKSKMKLFSGFGFRHDNINDIELSHTKNRLTTLGRTQLGDIDETNYFSYIGGQLNRQKWFLYGGLRYEQIQHRYENHLDDVFMPQSKTLTAPLPKFSVSYKVNSRMKLFGKWGMGMHSNDSRTVLNTDVSKGLPKVSSFDIGADYKAFQKLLVNVAYWNMRSEQEFVYVGDAGIVELNGPSTRQGIDLGVSWQPSQSLFFNVNANYSHARKLDDSRSYIPLAAPLTLSGTAQFSLGKMFFATWGAQWMADRPADETNSVVAEGYVLNNLKLTYKRSALQVQLQINNLFNTAWNETQFLTESRLKEETESVEEIHFTPGSPRSAQLALSLFF